MRESNPVRERLEEDAAFRLLCSFALFRNEFPITNKKQKRHAHAPYLETVEQPPFADAYVCCALSSSKDSAASVLVRPG